MTDKLMNLTLIIVIITMTLHIIRLVAETVLLFL